MSSFKILPDELIDIVESYADKIVLRKVDNILNIVEKNTDIFSVVYSPTIIIVRLKNDPNIYMYYKHNLSFVRRASSPDAFSIIDDKTVMTSGRLLNMENKKEETYNILFFYCNRNEGIMNYYTVRWSRSYNGSVHSLTTAKGNTWDISHDDLKYNRENIGKISDFDRPMCSINDEFLVLRSNNDYTITIANKNGHVYKLAGMFYRFYGSEYIVDFDGNVYKLELLDLWKIKN